MKEILLAVLIILLLTVIGYFAFLNSDRGITLQFLATNPAGNSGTSQTDWQTYKNSDYGFSISYPVRCGDNTKVWQKDAPDVLFALGCGEGGGVYTVSKTPIRSLAAARAEVSTMPGRVVWEKNIGGFDTLLFIEQPSGYGLDNITGGHLYFMTDKGMLVADGTFTADWLSDVPDRNWVGNQILETLKKI